MDKDLYDKVLTVLREHWSQTNGQSMEDFESDVKEALEQFKNEQLVTSS